MGTGKWVGMGMRTGHPSQSSLSHCKPHCLGLGLREPVPSTAQGQRGTRSKYDVTPTLPPASHVPPQASCVSLPAPRDTQLPPQGLGFSCRHISKAMTQSQDRIVSHPLARGLLSKSVLKE